VSVSQNPLILPLDKIAPEDIDKYGGKATNLARLNSLGFQIPQGFSISSSNFVQMVTSIPEISEALLEIENTDDFDMMINLSEQIQTLVSSYNVPEELRTDIEKHYHQIQESIEQKDLGYAVRSSATIEDREDISFAGQAATYLCIKGVSQIIDAIKRVWQSTFSPSALIYLKTKRIPLAQVKMAVVVQEMVQAKISGVMFTANVVNNKDSEILVNATWGWGEALVSGKVIPDTYVLEKNPLSIIQKNLGKKQMMCIPSDDQEEAILEETPKDKRESFTLEQDKLFEIVQLGLRIENAMGNPQDIEWCIKPDGKPMILQTRPITTLKFP
jgi:pyruvate,water dikinase